MPNNDFHFQGFWSPTTTPIPDQLFDEVMHLLTGAELKVVLYISRRTFGFKKDSDTISLNQIATGITTKTGKVLDSGTGLSKRHVQRALKTLEEKNIINVTRSVDATGLNEVNNYSLNVITNLHGVETLSPYRGDKSDMGVETPVSTTINSIQKTEEQHVVVVEQLKKFGFSFTTGFSRGGTNRHPVGQLRVRLAGR